MNLFFSSFEIIYLVFNSHLTDRPRSSRITIVDDMRFQQISYTNERELEAVATANKHSLFGKRIIYFAKQMITSQAGISKIVDGLFLSLATFERARF